jgi:hypothetical protein
MAKSPIIIGFSWFPHYFKWLNHHDTIVFVTVFPIKQLFPLFPNDIPIVFSIYIYIYANLCIFNNLYTFS